MRPSRSNPKVLRSWSLSSFPPGGGDHELLSRQFPLFRTRVQALGVLFIPSFPSPHQGTNKRTDPWRISPLHVRPPSSSLSSREDDSFWISSSSVAK